MKRRDTGYLILLNLAWRLRQARKDKRRCWEPMRDHATGAEQEAWNSFQAAKQIYYEMEN